ncbi:hypothetical protein G4B88_000650 [Cannabis sativa]|uniref:Uncharacterized protein n=1 Tax=Cannabis sativa TaxID=3483 RepID=A0A7J6HHW1_CANSA|nr:hypothetical protein G4B88_000650 [Cannabis sativa]
MIYGSTRATHFDQLAKILTGYEITGARSSGIFMGILSIAVGFLFKITVVPFQAAVGQTTAYSVVTQDKHIAHLLTGRIEVLFRSTVHPVNGKKHTLATTKRKGSMYLLRPPPSYSMGQQVWHPLEKRESTSDNHSSARQRSRVELREHPSDGKLLSRSVQRALFSLRISRSLSCEFPSDELKTCGALSIPSLEPRRRPPPLQTPYLF